MRSNFDELNPKQHIAVENTIVNNFEYVSDTPRFAEESDEEQACFDLLSAYIDGEVDASERKQVQEWLDNDPKIHQLYVQMLKLHQGIDQIPFPRVSSSQLSEQVFQRLDHERKRKFFSIGAAVISSIVIGILTSIVVKGNSALPKLAQEKLMFINKKEAGLMIALNYPIIDLPTTSISSKNISQAKK